MNPTANPLDETRKIGIRDHLQRGLSALSFFEMGRSRLNPPSCRLKAGFDALRLILFETSSLAHTIRYRPFYSFAIGSLSRR